MSTAVLAKIRLSADRALDMSSCFVPKATMVAQRLLSFLCNALCKNPYQEEASLLRVTPA